MLLDVVDEAAPPPPYQPRRSTCWLRSHHHPVPLEERRELDPRKRRVARHLARNWPTPHKITVLIVMGAILLHAHLGATMLYYAAAATDDSVTAELGIPGADAAAWGNAAYLLALAVGGLLWAPWSEEYGRRLILMAAATLGSIGGIIGTRAISLAAVIVARIIGGLAAGGSIVALAVLNDLFGPYDAPLPYASLFLSATVATGSALGPVVGPKIALAGGWRAPYAWIQTVGSVCVSCILFWTPETRSTVILDAVARRRRNRGRGRRHADVYGPNELAADHPAGRVDYAAIARRPLALLFSEPALVAAALVPAIANGLVGVLVQYLPVVYAERWGFEPGLLAPAAASAPLLVGCALGCALLVPAAWLANAWRRRDHESEWGHYDSRLLWPVFLAPALPLGLLGIAGTMWPPDTAPHWIGPVAGTAVAGLGNFALFACTTEYALRMYGPYAASSTAVVWLMRNLFAGALLPASLPMRRDASAAGATGGLLAFAAPLWFGVLCLAFCACCMRDRSQIHQWVADAESFIDNGVVHFLPGMPGCRSRTKAMMVRVESLYRTAASRVQGTRGVNGDTAEDAEPLAGLHRPLPVVKRFRLWMNGSSGPEISRRTENRAQAPADPIQDRHDELADLIGQAGEIKR